MYNWIPEREEYHIAEEAPEKPDTRNAITAYRSKITFTLALCLFEHTVRVLSKQTIVK